MERVEFADLEVCNLLRDMQVGHKRGIHAQPRVSTWNATMLRDKLEKIVAHTEAWTISRPKCHGD